MFHAKEYCAGDVLSLGWTAAAPAQEKPNHLPAESSSYLKRAISQPVDWYPWAALAFRRANELNRSILLDLGAAYAGAGSTFNASGACDAL
jgi:hypothetical protein